jgi:hypothetical protein
VPSLPSIQRATAASGPQSPGLAAVPSPASLSASGAHRAATKPPSRPLLPPNGPGANGSPSRPQAAAFSSQFQIQPGPGGVSPPLAAPPKGNALVYVLIAILVGAIGVLAYLVLTK